MSTSIDFAERALRDTSNRSRRRSSCRELAQDAPDSKIPNSTETRRRRIRLMEPIPYAIKGVLEEQHAKTSDGIIGEIKIMLAQLCTLRVGPPAPQGTTHTLVHRPKQFFDMSDRVTQPLSAQTVKFDGDDKNVDVQAIIEEFDNLEAAEYQSRVLSASEQEERVLNTMRDSVPRWFENETQIINSMDRHVRANIKKAAEGDVAYRQLEKHLGKYTARQNSVQEQIDHVTMLLTEAERTRNSLYYNKPAREKQRARLSVLCDKLQEVTYKRNKILKGFKKLEDVYAANMTKEKLQDDDNPSPTTDKSLGHDWFTPSRKPESHLASPRQRSSSPLRSSRRGSVLEEGRGNNYSPTSQDGSGFRRKSTLQEVVGNNNNPQNNGQNNYSPYNQDGSQSFRRKSTQEDGAGNIYSSRNQDGSQTSRRSSVVEETKASFKRKSLEVGNGSSPAMLGGIYAWTRSADEPNKSSVRHKSPERSGSLSPTASYKSLSPTGFDNSLSPTSPRQMTSPRPVSNNRRKSSAGDPGIAAPGAVYRAPYSDALPDYLTFVQLPRGPAA